MERGISIFFLIVLGAATCNGDIDPASYRLPEEVVPVSYDLWILTRLAADNFTFQGHVDITLNVLQTTDTVILHNDGLLIRNNSLHRGTNKSIDSLVPITTTTYNKQRQFYILESSKLEVGVYILTLDFEGQVRDDLFGFYRSSYGPHDINYMGVTQFSPVHARKAFPCMDEPHLKATFTLHVGHTRDQTATSNTVAESTVHMYDDLYVTTFSPTPKMSTYLVGWAIHDFVQETSAFSDNLSIWTRKAMRRHGTTSLYQGSSLYMFLTKYLKVPNPVPKMEQIALNDFNFNAMENWGMITYRESVLLYEGGVTPTKKMVDGFTTMAHEYAHTWFGNLVTPRFWDVAWLKEGFASYFQYFALSRVQPTWGMMDKFVVDILQPTLLLDAENHTRSMDGKDVGSPSSIMGVLDFVSYKKGASVIRMLSHVMGEPAFQDGLQNYLKNMSYKAASPSDLYHHFQASLDKSGEQNGVHVERIMDSWTDKPGFPLVTVTRDYEKAWITVEQQPFQRYLLRSNQTDEWWIPLNYVSKTFIDFSKTTVQHWLSPKNTFTMMTYIPASDWVIFNVQQMGYYRVNYDERNWRMIIDYLKSKDYAKIHRVNRAALVDDAFNLAREGYLNYSIAFDLAGYLQQEIDYEPWVAAVNSFKFLNRMLYGSPDVQGAFQGYVGRLLLPMYEKLSFNESLNEDITDKLSRELILSASCLLRNSDCLKTATSLFRKWFPSSLTHIPKDTKSFVYCEGVRAGNHEVWYQMLNLWKATDLHTEQELLLQALGCTTNATLINQYLEMSITDQNGVRKHYRINIVNAVLNGHVDNVEKVLEFVGKNLTTIINLRGHDFLDKIISAISNAITTAEQVVMLRSFVKERYDVLGPSLNGVEKALKKASETVQWIEHFSPGIAKYFQFN
ncbi:aminopeptidase N [Megachile rotundata]|uniref:aminopeptidase N n=1 Tax=Megachile rotundata TaxID=143995 RepID=UPI003FD508A5